jgi:hypothetical protein
VRLVILVIAILLLAVAPTQAAWKQHQFPELGFGVDFPAEPRISMGEWKGAVARTAPATVITAVHDNITFEAIVADFRNRAAETPTILGEAAYILSQEGALVLETMARTENGPGAIYGRRITVNLRDGSRKTTEVYATGGRLYFFATTVSAQGDLGTPIAARFQDSIIFDLLRDRTL